DADASVNAAAAASTNGRVRVSFMTPPPVVIRPPGRDSTPACFAETSPLRSPALGPAGRSLLGNAIVPQPGAGPRNRAIGLGRCWFAGRIQRRQPCVDTDAVSPKQKGLLAGRAAEHVPAKRDRVSLA